MSDADLDGAVARGLASEPQADDIALLQQLQQNTGALLHLVIWEPPPLFPGDGQAATRTMRSTDVQIAARFLVAVLKQLAARGMRLHGVELSNEPDGTWNIQIQPRDYVELVNRVRIDARRRSVELPRIYGPGTSTIAKLRTYLNDLDIGRAIIDNVDILSVHAWDSTGARDRFADLDDLLIDLDRLKRRPELAVTEFGTARPVPSDLSPQMTAKIRRPQSIADTLLFGSVNARDLLRLYANNVGTVIHWEFQDQSWGDASFGLLDERGRERPIYGMFRSLAATLASGHPTRITEAASGAIFIESGSRGARMLGVNTSSRSTDIVFDEDTFIPTTGSCRDERNRIGVSIPPNSLTAIELERR